MKLYRIECKIVEDRSPLYFETPRTFVFSDFDEFHEAKKWLEQNGHKIIRAFKFIPSDSNSVKADVAKMISHPA